MQVMEVAWIVCFFSLLCTNGVSYPCALINWFDYVADKPDVSVVHIDTIVYTAYLILIFGLVF